MRFTATNPDTSRQLLFDTDVASDLVKWLIVATTFAACCAIASWMNTAIPINTFIVAFGVTNVLRLVMWIRRFQEHISRSEHIFWEYTRLPLEQILARDETDMAIAAQLIRAKCVKAARRLGDGHDAIMANLVQSLHCELDPIALAGKVLAGMGLVGTCIGMMNTTAIISEGAKDTSNRDALNDAVANSLSSMSLSVTTTLTSAFLGSVVLTGLVMLARSKARRFVAQLNAQLDLFPIR